VAWGLLSGWMGRSTVAPNEAPCDPELTRVEEVAGLTVAYPECYARAGAPFSDDGFHGLTLTDSNGTSEIAVAITVVPPERWDAYVSAKLETSSKDCRITDGPEWQVWRCPGAAYRSLELVGHYRVVGITAIVPDPLADSDLANFVADVFERMVAHIRAQAPKSAPTI